MLGLFYFFVGLLQGASLVYNFQTQNTSMFESVQKDGLLFATEITEFSEKLKFSVRSPGTARQGRCVASSRD